MLLIELFESLDDAHVQSLIKKLRDAKEELKAEKARAASVQQSGISSSHRNAVDRATHAVKAAEDEIAAYKATEGSKEKAREFEKSQVEKRSAETPAQKKERLGKAISTGHKASSEVGDMAAKAKICNKIYSDLSNGGANVVKASHVAEKAAKEIGVTERQVYQWLEKQDAFKSLAQKLKLKR